jgi:hypothetical protein
MKFPSLGAERLHVVEAGISLLMDKMSKLEWYAAVIPNKRKVSHARSGGDPSETTKLHLVVGDVEFDAATGANSVG